MLVKASEVTRGDTIITRRFLRRPTHRFVVDIGTLHGRIVINTDDGTLVYGPDERVEVAELGIGFLL